MGSSLESCRLSVQSLLSPAVLLLKDFQGLLIIYRLKFKFLSLIFKELYNLLLELCLKTLFISPLFQPRLSWLILEKWLFISVSPLWPSLSTLLGTRLSITSRLFLQLFAGHGMPSLPPPSWAKSWPCFRACLPFLVQVACLDHPSLVLFPLFELVSYYFVLIIALFL